MNNKKQKLWVAAAMALLPAAALAAEPANYAGAHLGASNLDNWPVTVDFGAGVSANGNLATDSSWHGGFFIGRQTQNARFEVEYERGRVDIGGASLGLVGAAAGGGTGHYQALLLNAYRTHEFNPKLNGYAGIGIGVGAVSLPALAPLTACNCFRGASNTELALQARLGAEYQADGGHRVFVQYTWLRLSGPDSGGVPAANYSNKTIGSVSAGYRKLF